MKIYFLKRKGKNWFGNTLCNIKMTIDNEIICADYLFYRKKDAIKYLKTFNGKYGNPFIVLSAELKEDKTDNRQIKIRGK